MVLMSALTERKKKAAYNKWHNSEITFRGILNWRKQFTGFHFLLYCAFFLSLDLQDS